MKHFQSKVLTAAILATFCSGALAATNDDDVKKAATVAIAAAYNNGQEINGFKAGETIYDIGEDGTITKKDATAADVEADDFKGLGLKKVVTNLTKTVNENKQNVDAKVKAAETAAGKAEAAAGTANTAADKAEAVAAKVTDIKADIATNKDNIAKKANSADVYTREESDSKFVRIDGLNATTEKLDTRLASAEKSIADHDTRLNGLDKTVSDLRKETRQGLAEQAALSGLFQPYNVGRFNVTAAVGGYKSESAVAIGTGFRFTENFAAKAGVAVGTSSGSSAAYHVGVNYEWQAASPDKETAALQGCGFYFLSGRQTAASARSPVRIRIASSTGSTKILPSPILPEHATSTITSIARSTASSANTSSILTLGRKSTAYSAPR